MYVLPVVSSCVAARHLLTSTCSHARGGSTCLHWAVAQPACCWARNVRRERLPVPPRGRDLPMYALPLHLLRRGDRQLLRVGWDGSVEVPEPWPALRHVGLGREMRRGLREVSDQSAAEDLLC